MAIPTVSGKFSEEVPRVLRNNTGIAPLTMSAMKTSEPIFQPRIRVMLVAPILPLPFSLMSMPFTLPAKYPNGIEPIM